MKKYQGEALNILHTIGMDTLYPIIRISFKVNKTFNVAKFKKAVLQSTTVVPELLCKYNLNDNSFVPVVDDLTQVIFENINPDEDSAKWNLFKDPQLRIYLNKISKGYQVTIFLSHILTDGAGAKQFLYLLSIAYNFNNLEGIVNHKDITWLEKLIEKHPIKSDKKVDHPTKPLSLPRIASGNSPIRRTNYFKLNKKETAALIKVAADNNITLNDIFMASFGQAVQRLSFTDRIALACPVDMRKFIPGKKQLRIANHTSRYNINVFSDLEKPFAEVVAHVHYAMQENKINYQCLQSVESLIEQYRTHSLKELQQLAEDNYHVRSIAYTNFGIIDENKFKFGKSNISDLYLLGSYRKMPMFQVAVSTYKNEVYFSYAMIGNDQEALLGDSVIRTMRDLIKLYCGATCIN